MKKYIFLSLKIVLSLLLFPSCEKVIDIDLNSAAPKLVVEGELSDQPVACSIKLSKSINVDQSNTFPAVSGAVVKMQDDLGNMEILNETAPGVYTASTLNGIPGRSYILDITDNGKNYKSVSVMPAPVKIDTVYTRNLLFPEGFGITLFVGFKDPEAIENYYRMIAIVNGIPKTTFYVTSDQFQDGKKIVFQLEDDTVQKELVKGDSVTILLQCIDKAVYDYFYPMYFGSGDINPPSNISDEVLGYFSAYAVTSKTIVIQ